MFRTPKPSRYFHSNTPPRSTNMYFSPGLTTPKAEALKSSFSKCRCWQYIDAASGSSAIVRVSDFIPA